MKLKKGSAAAKAYMAKIRAKRKVGGVLNTLKHGASLAKKKVAYNVIDKAAKSANKTEKSALTKAKKVIQNTYLGEVATTKTGKPAKRLTKAQKDYNKDLDAYKYFVVKDGVIESGYEYKSDALDLANEFEPKAVVLSKKQLSSYPELKDFISRNKYTLGATKKVGSTLKLKANEKRLGATPKDVKTRSKSYHKDTKSHNVRISVVSGTNDYYLEKLSKALKRLSELETISIFYKSSPLKERKQFDSTLIKQLPILIKNEKEIIKGLKRYIK